MKSFVRQRKAQFVIIAALMIAIMMVSLGALLYSAVSYYKHEPWEEYLTLIGNIELSAHRLVELSLVNYTHTLNTNILKTNLEKWQSNLTSMYLGYGIALDYQLAMGTQYNYDSGLASDWYEAASFSAAKATFTLNITSIGLKGYKFMATPLLNLVIRKVDNATKKITVTITQEDGIPVTDLNKDNFQVDGLSIASVTSSYDPNYTLVYTIECATYLPPSVTVRVWDLRGIKVVATKTI